MGSFLKVIAGLPLLLAAGVLQAQTGPFFPPNYSLEGGRIDRLVIFTFWVTGIFLTAVVVSVLYFILRYRERPGHQAYYTHGKGKIEIGITLLLALLVFGVIDANVIHHSNQDYDYLMGKHMDPSTALRVEVQGRQFEWRIRYSADNKAFGTPRDITSLNQLHVPVNRPVFIQMDSADVIHSFYLPNFRVRQDVVPGLVNQVAFQAVEKGQFTLGCSELCGLGHYRMKGYVTVEDGPEFEKFLAEAAKSPEDPSENWGWVWQGR